MAGEEKKTDTCEKCGCEAELVVKEKPPEKPKKGALVCKACGNEANMILEDLWFGRVAITSSSLPFVPNQRLGGMQ